MMRDIHVDSMFSIIFAKKKKEEETNGGSVKTKPQRGRLGVSLESSRSIVFIVYYMRHLRRRRLLCCEELGELLEKYQALPAYVCMYEYEMKMSSSKSSKMFWHGRREGSQQ